MSSMTYLVSAPPYMAAKGPTATAINHAVCEKLHVINLNVGQGAGVLLLITKKETGTAAQIVYSFLIDGGYKGHEQYIRAVAGGRPIDAACITHADADHANCPVAMKASIAKFFLPYKPFAGITANATVPKEESTDDLWVSADSGAKLQITWLHVFSHARVLNDGENGKSLAAIITFGKFTFYFDGDLDHLQQLARSRPDPVNCLYVSHHGSEKTSLDTFLVRAKPQLAIISTGQNSHGHPDVLLIERLVAKVPDAHVLLTGCYYNRKRVNRRYWDTEYANLAGWIKNIQTGARPPDYCKVVLECMASLYESLGEAVVFSAVVPDPLILRTRSNFDKQFSDPSDGDGKAWTAMALLDPEFLAKVKLVFDAAQLKQDAAADDGKIKMSGGGDVMGGVIVTVDAASPQSYDVYWHDKDKVRQSKAFPLAMDGKVIADTAADYDAIYNKTFRNRGATAAHFSSSNRFKRDGSSPYKYKCLKCNENIHPKTEVLVSCQWGSCIAHGAYAYHATCFLEAWARRRAPVDLYKMKDNGKPDGVERKLKQESIATVTAYASKVVAYIAAGMPEDDDQASLSVPLEQHACLIVHENRAARSRKRKLDDVLPIADALPDAETVKVAKTESGSSPSSSSSVPVVADGGAPAVNDD